MIDSKLNAINELSAFEVGVLVKLLPHKKGVSINTLAKDCKHNWRTIKKVLHNKSIKPYLIVKESSQGLIYTPRRKKIRVVCE